MEKKRERVSDLALGGGRRGLRRKHTKPAVGGVRLRVIGLVVGVEHIPAGSTALGVVVGVPGGVTVEAPQGAEGDGWSQLIVKYSVFGGQLGVAVAA